MTTELSSPTSADFVLGLAGADLARHKDGVAVTLHTENAERYLEQLVDGLHREPLRVWSIVITIFGDAVVPRGGVISLSALQEITDRFRIAPSAVRAALSRLARDDWLTRERRGRRSYYALAPSGRAAFDQATRRIYAEGPPRWSGQWTICLAPHAAGRDREVRQRRLASLGFGIAAPGVYLRPETIDAPVVGKAHSNVACFTAQATDSDALLELVDRAWHLDEIAQGYKKFSMRFGPLEPESSGISQLTPRDAIALRTLIVHYLRRVVLKDPLLPVEYCPEQWPGCEARRIAKVLYSQLLNKSEAWLDACQGGLDGVLPPPSREFTARFGGLEL